MGIDVTEIENNIRRALVGKGSVDWLSQVSGIPRNKIYRRFIHPFGWRVDEIAKIAVALGVDVGDLIYGKEAQ